MTSALCNRVQRGHGADATTIEHMNVRPLHDRIIVQRLDEGEQQIGGIIIPDSAKEKPQQGKVLAVGDGRMTDDGKRIPLDVQPAISSCSESIPARKSSSTARSTSSSKKTKCSPSSTTRRHQKPEKKS